MAVWPGAAPSSTGGHAMRRYATVMAEKTSERAARELLISTAGERDAHAAAIQALLAHNASLRTNDELMAEQLRNNPQFRDEWQRTARARALATALVRYRADHGLSQRALSDQTRSLTGPASSAGTSVGVSTHASKTVSTAVSVAGSWIAVRPWRRGEDAFVSSEANSGSCDPARGAFSVATPQVYFRE